MRMPKMKFRMPRGLMRVGIDAGKFFFTGLVTRLKSGKLKLSLPKGTTFTKVEK